MILIIFLVVALVAGLEVARNFGRRRGMSNAGQKLLRSLTAVIVVLAIFFFMGRSLYRNWHDVRSYLASNPLKWSLVLLPFVFFGINFAIWGYAWKRVLAQFGEKIPYWKALQSIAYSQFGKYLPGKVWFAVGRVMLVKEAGVAERHSAAGLIVETAMLLITALVLFVLSLAFYPGLLAKTRWLLVLIPVTLAVLYPPIFNRVLNFLMARMKQKPIDFRLGFGSGLSLFLLHLSLWVCQGLGLYFLTLALYPVGLKALLVLPGAFAVSWIIGMVAVFAPAGLGVREGLFALLVDPILKGSVNIIVSLLSRIWITLSEILCFLLVFLLLKLRRSGVTQETRP